MSMGESILKHLPFLDCIEPRISLGSEVVHPGRHEPPFASYKRLFIGSLVEHDHRQVHRWCGVVFRTVVGLKLRARELHAKALFYDSRPVNNGKSSAHQPILAKFHSAL